MSWNILLTIVSVMATVAVACYTKKMHDIYKRMEKSQNQFNEQLSDLYQAIVIVTLQSANTDPAVLPGFIEIFKKNYKGKTKIF